MSGSINQHKRMAMGKAYKDGGAVEEEKRNSRPPKEAMGIGLLRNAVEAISGRRRKDKLDEAIESSEGESDRQRKMREEAGFKKGGQVKKGGK